MVSNLVVRNKRTGYVTFVGRERVAGESRTTKYHCGLGTMDQEEFKAFQKWAHSFKDQEMRVQMVLANPRAVEEKKEVTEKVAEEAQKKTTVKRVPRKARTIWKDKNGVRKHYPVPGLPGYRGKTHTQMMIERKKQMAIEAEMREEARLKKEGKPSKIKPVERVMPVSKFSPEGIAFARKSKKALARERIRR